MPFDFLGAQRASAHPTGSLVGAFLTTLVTTLVAVSPAAAATPYQALDPGLVEPGTSIVRPFDPPNTTRTIQISSDIDDSGATNVRPELTAAIAAAPDGSVISFPAGGVYRIDGKLDIAARSDLIVDGNGSTLRIGAPGAGAFNSVIDIWAGSTDIVIREFVLVGNSPKPGRLIDGQEFAMGVRVDIATRIEIDDVTISSVYGDALTVDSWADSIWFHDSRVASAGRNGIAILAGRNVIVERNTFDKVGLVPFDIEPYQASGGSIRVRFRQNTIRTYGTPGSDAGQWAVMFAANGAQGSTVEDVRVTRNTVIERSIQSQITTTTRRRSIMVANNRSLVEQAPYYNSPAVLWFAHVDGLTVYGNIQPLSEGSLLYVHDSTDVDRW